MSHGPFDHRAHIQVAWDAIRRVGLAGALLEVPAFLRGMATAAGRSEKYHETMTLGWLLLIADRFRPDEPFDAFCDRNPDLLATELLTRFWRPDTLASARARRQFVFPDLTGG
jgi:hypothetical protein